MQVQQTRYCFLDTNALIHFTTFNEVDWPSVLNAEQVCLVLAPIVLRELDAHKNDSRIPWRQRRARMLSSKFNSLLASVPVGEYAQVREGVSILAIGKEPQVEWGAFGLDKDINDDRLLATIIEFGRDNQKSDCLLLSNDFGIALKARIQDITCLDPENVIGRLEQVSPEESKIRELERQIQQYERRIPDLNLSFWQEEQTTTKIELSVAAKSGWRTDEQLSAEITEKRTGVKRFTPLDIIKRIPQADQDKFHKEHEQYLADLLLARKMERSKDFGHRCELSFVLNNTGTVPASDVEITLWFPPETFVVDIAEEEDSLMGKAFIPTEPKPEWLSKNSLLPEISISLPPRSLPPSDPKPRGPLYDYFGDRSLVSYRHPKMRQQDEWHMPPLFVYLPPTSPAGFQLEFEVRADEIPRPLNGVLNVVLKSKH